MIPNVAVSHTSPDSIGTLTFTPTAGLSGSAVITVTVNDGQGSNNTIVQTFTVTVEPDAGLLNALLLSTIPISDAVRDAFIDADAAPNLWTDAALRTLAMEWGERTNPLQGGAGIEPQYDNEEGFEADYLLGPADLVPTSAIA